MKPHKWKLTHSQTKWLVWLMKGYDLWLWDHIGGRDSGQLKWNRLESILLTGEYSQPDKEFLNWLRERFISQGCMDVYKKHLSSSV